MTMVQTNAITNIEIQRLPKSIKGAEHGFHNVIVKYKWNGINISRPVHDEIQASKMVKMLQGRKFRLKQMLKEKISSPYLHSKLEEAAPVLMEIGGQLIKIR